MAGIGSLKLILTCSCIIHEAAKLLYLGHVVIMHMNANEVKDKQEVTTTFI